jgi:alkylation response protein AidB-like acyl-CoA dehydrogenase
VDRREPGGDRRRAPPRAPRRWRIDLDGVHAARDDISMIKFVVANTLFRVLDRAIQAHGGAGHHRRDAARLVVPARARGADLRRPDEVHQAAVARHILRARGLPDRRGGG